MKKLVYTISILLMACSAFTQDLNDALRYSNHHISGTARSAAMGNAFGALGGDFSSLSINPAGLGVYRSGEFVLTPSFGQTSVDGTYLGKTLNESNYNLSLDNLGYVSSFKTGENSESGLVSVNFGLGFNKLGTFTMNNLVEGSNAKSSLLGYWTANMNADYNSIYGKEADMLDSYYERLAWDTYLINHDDNAKEYFNDLTDKNYGQSVNKTMERKGYINEYVLSVAANFNYKFFLGATLGIQNVYFKDNTNIKEWDAQNNIPNFGDFNFNTHFNTTGSGLNLKLGAIFKPIEALRLGVAFHTPTFYKLNDVGSSNMSASTHNNGETVYPDNNRVYDYEIETPMKGILSAAWVLGKSGLISVDYEIVDYSTSKIKNGSDGYNFMTENRNIGEAYKTTGNLHVGGEYRVNKNFSLRAGYENFPSVYKATYKGIHNPNSDFNFSAVSGGFGFRQGNVFFDAAYKRVMNTESLKFYPDYYATEMAKYEETKNNIIFTLGFKF